MYELERICLRISQLELCNTTGKSFQEIFAITTELSELRRQKALLEHTLKIKNKVESGSAIDKSIVDREATKELVNKQAHNTAIKAKAIEHKIIEPKAGDKVGLFGTIIADLRSANTQELQNIASCVNSQSHVYLICSIHTVTQLRALLYHFEYPILELIHTFKYSSKKYNPKIGFKEHYEYVLYLNLGNKPVNHLLPNVIESTYEKDSRNLGFYTNLLLRSVQAGDTILGINITNGNLIKAAQAMLCSTVTVPVDSVAKLDCEKIIKELQFK